MFPPPDLASMSSNPIPAPFVSNLSRKKLIWIDASMHFATFVLHSGPKLFLANKHTNCRILSALCARSLLPLCRSLLPLCRLLLPCLYADRSYPCTKNFSILHGLRDNYFKRHYVKHGPDNSQTSFPSRDHIFRRQCYDSNPGILYVKFNVQQYWQGRRYLKQNKWLEQWLRREIQTLTMVEDVDVVVHHILGVIEDFMKRQLHEISRGTYEQKREEFKILVADAAKPFISEWAMRFVDELELFLASCLTCEAYDKLYIEAMSNSGSASTEVSFVEPLLYVSDEDVDNK